MSIIEKILENVKEEAKQEATRHHTVGVYRASEIGGCGRALQYATLKYPAETLTAETHLIFKDGHTHHAAVRELLGKIGTLSHIERTMQKRYTYNGVKFIVTFTLDGMWNNMPFDVKSMSTFMFAKLDKEYPKEYNRYITQLMLYLDVTERERGFFIFKNKNDGELKIKYVYFEKARFESILHNISIIHKGIKSKTLLERPYPRDHYFCKTCPYRLPCWNLPMEGKHWGTPFKRRGTKVAPGATLAGQLKQSISEGGRRAPKAS